MKLYTPVKMNNQFFSMFDDEPLTDDDRDFILKHGLHCWALQMKLAGQRYGVTRDRTTQRKCEANSGDYDISSQAETNRAETA